MRKRANDSTGLADRRAAFRGGYAAERPGVGAEDAERASVTLSARLAGSDGPVTLMLRGGGVVTGTILEFALTSLIESRFEFGKES